jgi:hypothetical protein
MTFIGKLLVIIQLVLSICFMALAGAIFTRQQTWQAATVTAREKVAQLQIALNETETVLDAEIDRLSAERDNAENGKTAAENKRVQAELSNDNLQDDLETLNLELTTQKALADITATEATMRREEALTMRNINQQQADELNKQNTRVRQKEDENFNMNVERKSLVSRYNELLSSVAVYRRVLASNGFSTDPKDYARQSAPTPLVFGEVLETKKSARAGRELIEVSIGSDDGVREGTVLYVYRVGDRNKFLGQIRLELVTPDRSVGIVTSRAKNGVIERKDYVTTRL